MANVILNDTHLTNIANAIREKNGEATTYTPGAMADAIINLPSGGDEEPIVLTGNGTHRFYQGGWDWFIEKYGNRIILQDFYQPYHMFDASKVAEIPFTLNFTEPNNYNCEGMFTMSSIEVVPDIDFKHTTAQAAKEIFSRCQLCHTIGKISNLYPKELNMFFYMTSRLRYFPELENWNFTYLQTKSGQNANIFNGCLSLRSIPEDFLKQLYGPHSYSYSTVYGAFSGCYALDEVRGVRGSTNNITSNMFSSTFKSCYRLKDVIFAVQDDGTPYAHNWNSQTIDLSFYTGYGVTDEASRITTNYNSGITADKEVVDDATYQALKNDADWFTCDVNYSRYNHDSAVNTINSLPDTSAYLAANGGTNTIKFRGAAGALTDGGAINTLTEEEIAVATAKGWTVSLA